MHETECRVGSWARVADVIAPRDFQSSYVRRIVDEELDELAGSLPAILLDGPKGVGKTETALQRAATVRRLDRTPDREVLRADPDRIADDNTPVLIDEWQRLPEIWDTVRRHVDTDTTGGRFLLTGSTPSAVPAATHTGAGRITAIRLRPLTLPERLDLHPTVSLRSLLDDNTNHISGSTEIGLLDYVTEIATSGLPGLRHLGERARRNQLDSYLDLIVNRELAEAGLHVRRPQTALGWLRAYAAAISTTTTWEKIRNAATPGQNPPAATTARPYIELLTNLRILDPLPAWLPTNNHLRSLTSAPKHHLADPALALRLLNLPPDQLLDGRQPDTPIIHDGTYLGALFESLVALTLRVFAQSAGANIYHLRTKGGRHEVDFIIEHPNGVLAIESKLAPNVDDHDVRHLHWLRNTTNTVTDLAIITTGTDAYRRDDNIAVIPLALLGP